MAVLLLVPRLGRGQENLTADQMKTKAEALVAEMRGMRDNAEAMLREARAAKQMDVLDVINEALIALKGVLKLAEDYLYDLQAGYKDGDVKEVKSNFTKIKIAHKKVSDLDARVRSAGGASDSGIVEGEPTIEKTADSDLPSQDPLEGLESESVFVEKPAGASPFN